jgi:hypothetical protein
MIINHEFQASPRETRHAFKNNINKAHPYQEEEAKEIKGKAKPVEDVEEIQFNYKV